MLLFFFPIVAFKHAIKNSKPATMFDFVDAP